MRYTLFIAAASAALLVSACAEQPLPPYRVLAPPSPPPEVRYTADLDMDCAALWDALQATDHALHDSIQDQGSIGGNMAAGLLLGAPGVMNRQASIAAESARIQGRREHLERLADKKNCGF
jgi:hypothetical protein